jgi:chorismate dehydratase
MTHAVIPGMLRVGHLNFVNAYPLYSGLVHGAVQRPVELISGVPAELNQMLRAGDLDLSLVSAHEYLTNAERYDLLPGFCQAAAGPVRSVTLHYKGDLKELSGKPLALTQQSASSANLVRAFCRTFWHITPEFVPLPDVQSCTDHPAFLLIGDEALLHPGFPGYNRIDMAEAFVEKTQLPMTFAVFAVRKEVASDRPQQVMKFCEKLNESLKWYESNFETVCEIAAENSPIPIQILRAYYPLLTYRLGKPELHGLRTYASLLDVPIPHQLEEMLK